MLSLRLLLLSTLSIVLMVCDQRYYSMQSLRAELTLFVVPLQYIVNFPFHLYRRAVSDLASRDALLKQNQLLQTEQLLLKARVQKLLNLEQENKQLRALLKSAPKAGDKVLAGQVLSVGASPFADEIIINKGRRQGLYLGQPVLDAQGVLGQVVEVDPLTSRAILISDLRSAVPVRVNRNGYTGVVVGMGANNRLAMIHVPKTAEIQEEDVLVTSGLGLQFPVGYPVGVIEKITARPGEMFLTVAVRPSADMNRVHQLLLAWPAWHDSARQREVVNLLHNHKQETLDMKMTAWKSLLQPEKKAGTGGKEA